MDIYEGLEVYDKTTKKTGKVTSCFPNAVGLSWYEITWANDGCNLYTLATEDLIRGSYFIITCQCGAKKTQQPKHSTWCPIYTA